MTKVEIAKNLLQDKTCETCKFGYILFGRKQKCSRLGTNKKGTNFPKSLTCKFWENFDRESVLQFVKTKLPSLLEEELELVSIRPEQEQTGTVFYIETKKMSKIRIFFRRLSKRKKRIFKII